MRAEADQAPREEAGLLGILGVLVANRWIIVLPALLVAFGAGLRAITRHRTFTSKASFMPENGTSALATYAALAAQLGVALPNTDNGQSPEFYVYLLQSDALLGRVAGQRFRVGSDTGTVLVELPELLGVVDPPGNARTVHAIAALRRAMVVRDDPRAGLITVSVKTRWAELSAAVADSLISEVDWFNREVRHSQAGAERIFSEGRLAAAQADLRTAEDDYEAFLERNRNYSSSPALTFQAARLQRAVSDHEQLAATLRQAYEQARLQEVRNTPVISVIEVPAPALTPDKRNAVIYTFLGLIGGALCGCAIVLGTGSLGSGDSAERQSLTEIRAGLGRFWAELRRPAEGVRAALAQWRSLF